MAAQEKWRKWTHRIAQGKHRWLQLYVIPGLCPESLQSFFWWGFGVRPLYHRRVRISTTRKKKKNREFLVYRRHPQPTHKITTWLITTDPIVSCSKKCFWGTSLWSSKRESLNNQVMLYQVPCLSFTPCSSAYRGGQIARSALSIWQCGLLCFCQELAVCEAREFWESRLLLISTLLVRKANKLVPD